MTTGHPECHIFLLSTNKILFPENHNLICVTQKAKISSRSCLQTLAASLSSIVPSPSLRQFISCIFNLKISVFLNHIYSVPKSPALFNIDNICFIWLPTYNINCFCSSCLLLLQSSATFLSFLLQIYFDFSASGSLSLPIVFFRHSSQSPYKGHFIQLGLCSNILDTFSPLSNNFIPQFFLYFFFTS